MTKKGKKKEQIDKLTEKEKQIDKVKKNEKQIDKLTKKKEKKNRLTSYWKTNKTKITSIVSQNNENPCIGT